MFLKKGRKEIAVEAVNSIVVRELRRGLYRKAKQELRKPLEKMIGKPYSGKPYVRFDEVELGIELFATTPALYATALVRRMVI